MSNPPLVHLYFGDGKGKTTAAIGLAVRAKGAGLRVWFFQFLKGRDTGELQPLSQLGILVQRAPDSEKFVFSMTQEEKEQARKECTALLNQAKQGLLEGQCDLLVLDEVTDAADLGLISLEELDALLDSPKAELVLTGHTPAPCLLERADYLTRMTQVKHPYQKGISARRGIEF